MKGIDDTAHFRGIEQRVDEIISILKTENKAGFNPNQARDSSGKWTSSGMSQKRFEDMVRHQEYESAAVYDEDGKLILTKDGTSQSISFTEEEILKTKGMTLTHNHPFPGTGQLSVQDIAAGLWNEAKSVKAFDTFGEWQEVTYNWDYINKITNELAEIQNVDTDQVNLGSLIKQIGDHFLREKQNDFMFQLNLATNQNNPDAMYKMTREFSIEQIDTCFKDGYKALEENWAPLEVDKLFTIKDGKDEI